MKNHRAAFSIGFGLVVTAILSPGFADAQDLLGSTRTQMLARMGHPEFAPCMGDEEKAEQFHVGSWFYIAGYRVDKADPQNDDKMKVICVMKRRDFGSAQTIEAAELRVGLMEAQNSPEWKPFDPLPDEVNPKPGEKYRDFESLHTRKSDGVLTAKGQTTRRRQRLFTSTLDWHGNPVNAASAWFFDLPADKLEQLFKDFKGSAEEKLKLLPEPPEEYKKLLRVK